MEGVSENGSPVDPIAPVPGPPLPPRYDIMRLLGQGAMGKVYLCHDRDLDVDVAVKVLRGDLLQSPRAVARLRREARAAAQFNGGEGILAIYTFGIHEGLGYIVMEHAPGGSLKTLLEQQRRLPEALCRRFGAQVARALAHAHERDMVHRDVKPANVLLDARQNARLADFGIAKVLAQTVATQTNETFIGTPVYMAPEILEGLPVDGRADLYSLGCMLYEMAAGEPPFKGTFPEIALTKTRPDARVPDPRNVLPTLSEDFAGIVRSLLARNPEHRADDAMQCASRLDPSAVKVAPVPPIRVFVPEKRDIALASALFRKGEALQADGAYDHALRFLERALEVDTRLYGEMDALVARDLKFIARNWHLQGHHDKAEAPFVRSLRILESTNGENHPDVAHGLMFLGRLLALQERHADAATVYGRALLTFQKSGSRHTSVLARILNSLAAAEIASGRPERARPLLERCLAVMEERKGRDHPSLHAVLNTFASFHLAMGDERACEAALKRALSILESAYGKKHHSMAESLEIHASLLRRQGRERDARRKRREADRLRQGQPPGPPSLPTA